MFSLSAYLLVAAAFVAFIADGQRWVANGVLDPLAFGRLLQDTAPSAFAAIEPAVVRHLHPLLWDIVLKPLFAVPAFLVLGLAGALTMAAARPVQTPIGYAPR